MIKDLTKLANILDNSGFTKEADRVDFLIKESAAKPDTLPKEFTTWLYRSKRDNMGVDTRVYRNLQMADINNKLNKNWSAYQHLYEEWLSDKRVLSEPLGLEEAVSDGVLTPEEVSGIGEMMSERSEQLSLDWGTKKSHLTMNNIVKESIGGDEEVAEDAADLPAEHSEPSSEDSLSSIKPTKEVRNIGNEEIVASTFSLPGGAVTVWENSPYAGGAHSIYSFVVNEDQRGRGIGSRLIDIVIQEYSGDELSAQVSGMASLKVFFNKGFRPSEAPGASLHELVEMFNHNYGSLNMRLN
jgi:ribosomal protein S18 acetylase RimI-like enzyme